MTSSWVCTGDGCCVYATLGGPEFCPCRIVTPNMAPMTIEAQTPRVNCLYDNESQVKWAPCPKSKVRAALLVKGGF